MNGTALATRSPIRVAPSRHQRRARRFERAAEPKRMHLTDRDLAVLDALNTHRFLSGDQLGRLVFDCGDSRTRRRLRRLFDHGFVERISVVAQPTRGIPPFLYALTHRGAAALEETGMHASGGGVNGTGVRNVRHELAVRDFFIALTNALSGTPYRLSQWRYEQELKLAGNDGRGRVEQVRHPTLQRPLPILPDAYLEIDLGNGSSFAFFLEMDMATHSQRTWQRRARLYAAYADPAAGLFRRRFGRETFRLLITTPRDFRQRSRRDNILRTIERTVGPSELFLAATLEEVTAERILTRVWKRVGTRQPCSIVENPGTATSVVVRPARARAAQ